jgi:hypothetical protein
MQTIMIGMVNVYYTNKIPSTLRLGGKRADNKFPPFYIKTLYLQFSWHFLIYQNMEKCLVAC